MTLLGVIKKILVSKVFNGLFFLLITFFSYSQNVKDLREVGNYVQFIFNTLDQYQSGITLDGYTRISIKFRYDGASGWEVRLFTQTSSIEYEGDPIENMNLSDLTITPTIISSTDATAAINGTYLLIEGPYNPADLSQVLLSGDGGTVGTDPPIEVEFTISYGLNSMINKASGLYFVTLQFLLVEK